MKSLSRRQFLAAATSTIGAGLLAACGASATPTATPKPAAPAATAVPAAATKPPVAATPQPAGAVTIRWTSDEAHAYHADQIALFQKNNPNIKIQYDVLPDQRGPKYLSMIAAKDVPDANEFATPDDAYSAMSQNNLLLPVDTSAVPLDDFIPGGLAQLQNAKGQQLGVPLMLDGKPFMYFNLAALQAAGLSIDTFPSEPAAWLEAIKKLTKKDAAGKVTTYGLRMSAAWSYSTPWLMAYATPKAGGKGTELDYVGGATADTFKINTPELIKGMKDFIGMFQQGIADSSQDRVKGLAANFYAGAAGGTWLLGDITKGIPDMKVGVLPPPHVAGRPALLWSATRCEGVSTSSKNPKEAFAWIKFITSRDELVRIYKDGAYLPATNAGWDYLAQNDAVFKTYNQFKNSWVTFPTDPVVYTRVENEVLDALVGDLIAGKMTVENGMAQAEKDAKAIMSGAK